MAGAEATSTNKVIQDDSELSFHGFYPCTEQSLQSSDVITLNQNLIFGQGGC